MNTISQSCVLLLWMHALTFIKCQECTLEDFIKGPMFDSNFDTTGLEATYQSQQQVRVPCAVGHSGFFKLICNNGQWQFRGTKCQPRPCGHPGEAQFADFHLELGDDFVFGSQVKYTCHKGYQMVSRTNYRRCVLEGWSGTIPVCEVVHCPAINVEDNVEVIGDAEEANFGNVLQFSCKKSNEILIGSSEMSCDENGKWSNTPPKCEEIKCPAPVIENGFVPSNTDEYKEHEVLFYQCNPKYKQAEGRPSKCTKVGLRAEWSPAPSCEVVKCKVTLPSIEGTSYEPDSMNVFIPGDKVKVTCGQNFWILNSRQTSVVSTCQENGKWTIRPVCQEFTCRNHRDKTVSYWNVYWGQVIKLNTSVEYQCNRGHKPTAGATRLTCTKDGWTPNPPCREILCDSKKIQNAVNLDDGQHIYREYDRAQFVCKSSRERFTLTCEARGWRGSVPCAEQQCQNPDLRSAEIVHNDKNYYDHGEEVQYACKNDIDRQFTVTCEFGVWTGIQNCSACLEQDVIHGFAVGRPSKEKLYYTCNEGYKLPTKGWWGEATCVDGLWFGLEQCVENNKCAEIPMIANAKVQPNNGNGQDQRLQIICKSGYQTQQDHLLCVKGKWDSNGIALDELCSPIGETCSPPPKVENAVILTSFRREFLSGSNVRFKCRQNFMIEGEDTITCQNGQWDTTDIKCTPYCSKPKYADQMMTLHVDKEKYVNGEILQYRCIRRGEQNEGFTTCVNGKWREPIQCEVKPCPLPENIPNGRYQLIHGEDFVFGATIQYFCDEGYQMVSKIDTRICLLDKWTNHVPICEPVHCEAPPKHEEIVVKGLPDNDEGILPDRFLTFSCNNPGKQLNGSPLLVCGKDGLWDKPFPTCEDIACKVGAIQPHLSVDQLPPGNQTIRIGHRLRFRCSDDYALDGSEETECLPTGEWKVPFPKCSEPCQITGVPNNVRLSTQLRVRQARRGQRLTFSCLQRGDTLLGKNVVVCLSNGLWSDPFPTCGAPSECQRPPHLPGGDTKYSTKPTYGHDERVEYICQHYYQMEGEPYKTCKNGQWTGDMKCLKPCTVNRELMNRHGVTFRYKRDGKLYSAHNDIIEFWCVRGTRHDGVLAMRQKCIDGMIDLPTCH
ncbi:complement factor H-like isoform X1 [Nerophis ophidion]|uniref:complement factor H-like isoform X1 n=1 Tax=Nerophis ophidion TaxID=159077 RepID=UPI002ADF721B|nr:complement factor H-like isoform X1 [Nerophis ophidion]XP_061739792.1 complement factor H-like isoform X1 [Nerophis ophidion]